MLTPATRSALQAAFDKSARNGTKPTAIERIIASLGAFALIGVLAMIGGYISVMVIQYQTLVIEKQVRECLTSQ